MEDRGNVKFECLLSPLPREDLCAPTLFFQEVNPTRASRGQLAVHLEGQSHVHILKDAGLAPAAAPSASRMSRAGTCCKVLPRAVTSRIPPRIESVIKTRMSGAPAVKSPSPGPAGKRRCCTARLATSRLTQNLQATRIEVGNRGADVWARYI